MPTTADTPKCYAEVKGRRLLDWGLDTFADAGIRDVCFIGGYQIEKVQRDYNRLTFRHNKNWEQNNILASLMYAEDLMHEGFICCYSDTLFTERVVRGLLASGGDIVLSVDTRWLDRYQYRTQHPPDDAEKVVAQNGWISRVHRSIPAEEAYGEYTGLAKFTPAGAAVLRAHYHDARRQYSGKEFREAVSFEKAYLIHLFQGMIESGVRFSHADTAGDYLEVDTQEDFELARKNWTGKTSHLSSG